MSRKAPRGGRRVREVGHAGSTRNCRSMLNLASKGKTHCDFFLLEKFAPRVDQVGPA